MAPLIVTENTYLHKRVELLGVGFGINSLSNEAIATFIKDFRVKLPENLDLDFRAGGYIQIYIPPYKDLSFKSFDGMGNYSFGIKEQVVFAEIDYDKVDSIRGMDVIITTSSSNDEVCYELLRAMGLPIREKKVVNDTEEQDG